MIVRDARPNQPRGRNRCDNLLPMILIRVMVGLIFLLEGVLKFVRPEALGAGRFAAIGLPFPHQLASA
jgi:uncharacterized membrane protein YphA (DoxX/SURF4 family)